VGLDLVRIMNDLPMTWWLKSSSAATGSMNQIHKWAWPSRARREILHRKYLGY